MKTEYYYRSIDELPRATTEDLESSELAIPIYNWGTGMTYQIGVQTLGELSMTELRDLAASLEALSTQINNILNSLGDKADRNHKHVVADLTDLEGYVIDAGSTIDEVVKPDKVLKLPFRVRRLLTGEVASVVPKLYSGEIVLLPNEDAMLVSTKSGSTQSDLLTLVTAMRGTEAEMPEPDPSTASLRFRFYLTPDEEVFVDTGSRWINLKTLAGAVSAGIGLKDVEHVFNVKSYERSKTVVDDYTLPVYVGEEGVGIKVDQTQFVSSQDTIQIKSIYGGNFNTKHSNLG